MKIEPIRVAPSMLRNSFDLTMTSAEARALLDLDLPPELMDVLDDAQGAADDEDPAYILIRIDPGSI